MFMRIAVVTVLLVLVAVGCSSKEKQYLTQMAEWHVRWSGAFLPGPDGRQGLLEELAAIEPPWKGGPNAVRHQEYMRAHQLRYLAGQAADEVAKAVTNALEPYERDSFYSCSRVISEITFGGDERAFLPSATRIDFASGIEEEYLKLSEAGVNTQDVSRVCAMEQLADQQLVTVRLDAQMNWMRKEYRAAWDKRYLKTPQAGESEPPGDDADATPDGFMLDLDISKTETSIRCPSCDTLKVTEVLSGDTLVTDQGLVRLYGADAPKRGEICYGTAADTLSRYVFIGADYELESDTLAGTVRVKRPTRTADSKGNVLYYVFTESGNSIDEVLVSMGLAKASARQGEHRSRLLELEATAPSDKEQCYWR